MRARDVGAWWALACPGGSWWCGALVAVWAPGGAAGQRAALVVGSRTVVFRVALPGGQRWGDAAAAWAASVVGTRGCSDGGE